MDQWTAEVKAKGYSDLEFLHEILAEFPADMDAMMRLSMRQFKETFLGIGFKETVFKGKDLEDMATAISECKKIVEEEIVRRHYGGEPRAFDPLENLAPKKENEIVKRTSGRKKKAPVPSPAAADDDVEEAEEYEVEEVVGKRTVGGKTKYLVKFKGYELPEYVLSEDMIGSQALVDKYEKADKGGKAAKGKTRATPKMEKKSPAPSSAPKRGRRKASPGTKVAKPPAKKAKKTASPKKGGEDVKVEEAPAVSSSVSAATTPRRGGRRGAAAKKEAPAEKPAPTKRGRSASAAKKTSPAPAKKAKPSPVRKSTRGKK